MTDQSTPTISDVVEAIFDEYRATIMSSIGQGVSSEGFAMAEMNARAQLISLLADFAERITPEKKEDNYPGENRTGAQIARNYVFGHNDAVDTITQNVKAELGATPKELGK